MMLLTIRELEEELNAKFLPLEPAITGLRLVPGGLSELDMSKLENFAVNALPPDFKSLLARYDFGHLVIGPVTFSNSGEYVREVIGVTEDLRLPSGMLLVAGSDPDDFVLNVSSGEVLLFDRETWQIGSVVAKSFEDFLKGVGTAMLRREEANKTILAKSIAHEVASREDTFWRRLVV